MKKKVRKNGLWVLLFLVIVLLCITAPLYAVYSPTEVDLGNVLQKPNTMHWFGTDSSGRDVFTRTMYGGMVSLAVAAASSLCALLFGIIYGGISGYVGGKLDTVMMRMVDIAYAMPSTIVALAFQMIFPNKVLGLVIVMSLTSWMTMARVIRARFQELKKENYIMLAEGFNIPRYVILFHHMVRNSFSSIIIIATFTFASAIVTETSLSYLGVGIPIGIPSWGNMINGIQSYVLSGKWWIVLPPGVMIILSSICVNYVGEYLKEKPHAKVGFIIHGAMFYGTTERDNYAEKILRESYPDIEITARKGFIQIENAYKVCYEMINEHPDIQALYVSWDRPALLAIKALKALNRTDIAVFTTDLDFEIAQEMNQGFVKGLSTQRPYDQGKAAALAVAKSLVSDNVPKYIGVQPYVVHEKQLKRAWKDIFFEALPEELGEKQMGQ